MPSACCHAGAVTAETGAHQAGATGPDVVEVPLLSARSVALSLLLGSHPDRMSAARLVAAGEHFGVPTPTMRVALTRAVAGGDLVRDGSSYALAPRLAERQRRQDEALDVDAATTPWDGSWELAVVVVTGRPGGERATLRDLLRDARLAEQREGVWTRPANLRREPAYRADPVLASWRGVPDADPALLAASLWDLDGWADVGRSLEDRLRTTDDPAVRLAVAAAVVRHLTTDPLLPVELCPAGWPGAAMRAAYRDYQDELRALA